MPLWGKTDAEASRPKWVNLATYPAGTQLLFVDETEAQQPENKARGLTNAGWWLYRTYTDTNGSTRYDNECLVAITNTAVAAGDAADDAVVVDRTITITVAPTAQTAVEGQTATFSVTATVDPTTTLSYQWQKQEGGSGAYAVISGATSASYTTGALTVADDNGDRYRVVVSASGATAKTTTGVALTVTAA